MAADNYDRQVDIAKEREEVLSIIAEVTVGPSTAARLGMTTIMVKFSVMCLRPKIWPVMGDSRQNMPPKQKITNVAAMVKARGEEASAQPTRAAAQRD